MLQKALFQRLWQDQRGQDMVEYALIAAFISAAAMAISPAILTTAAFLQQSMRVLDLALSLTAGQ
jgi:Flp pilus assembly pilin Flp